MRRINRDRLWRGCAVLAAVIVVVFLFGWALSDLNGGVLFAIAIGIATAIAVFSDRRHSCSPRFLRRRDRL